MEYIQKHGAILVIMVIYTVFCLGIGQWFKHRASRSVDDFYVAKRTIPGWAIALAFFSTFISTNTYIGQAGYSFRAGLSWVWVGVFWTFFCMISWLVMGPRMRSQTAKLKSVTIPDYFDFRYKSVYSRAIRIFSAVIILFATVWYMVAIAKGCAHLLHSTLEIPYAWGAFLIVFITTLYSVMGGMYSVLWTDAVQGAIMFVVALIMIAIPFAFVGGVEPVMQSIAYTTHPSVKGTPIGDGLVVFCALVSFLYIASIGLSVGMKQIAEPRCLIRFYSVDNAKSMKFAMIATPILLGISLICVFSVGALVHGMTTPQEAAYLVKHTDEVIGFMLAKMNNPWITGICMAGLFAAGMSSLASVILIVGTAFIGDIWNLVRPLSQPQQVSYTKWLMWLYSALVVWITIYPPAGIVELTAFSGAVFAAGFFPAVYGGLYWRWGTGAGAFWSMVIGIVGTVGWRFLVRFNVPGMRDYHEIFAGFIVSIVAYVVISLLTQGDRPSEEHLDHVFHTNQAK